MKLLNIACGSRYHTDWINIDFHPGSQHVDKVNILEGLPFQSGIMDAIYSSHFIEHLSVKQASYVLSEAARLLKDGGTIRIVVPDLENICREYLTTLVSCVQNKIDSKRYEWIVLEMLDQLVRTKSGGGMQSFFNRVIKDNDKEIASYISNRTGDNLLSHKSLLRKKKVSLATIYNRILYIYLKIVSQLIPNGVRDLIFCNTTIGERHQWMYDRYSMSNLLIGCGFRNISIEQFNRSRIPDFNRYLLDINEDGSSYKGSSSLYIEACK